MTAHPLDESDLAPKFRHFYESGQRIIVHSPWGEELRGYVGKTTGWRPSYLLLARKNSTGSSVLLDEGYRIVGTLPRWRRR